MREDAVTPGMTSLRFGLSGVGSLPFAAEEEAISHIRSHYAPRDFVPELPRLPGEAGMIARMWPAEDIESAEGGVRLRDDPDRIGERLKAKDLSTLPFLRTIGRRLRALSGPVVAIHLAGPVTLLRATTTAAARGELWSHPRLREPACAYIAAIAAAVAADAASTGRSALIVLDEPSLTPPTVDVDNPANLMLFSKIIQAVEDAGGKTGIHSCGTPPTALLLHLDFAAAFFDARSFGPELASKRRTLERFLRRGGELGYGVFDARDADDDLEAARRTLATLPLQGGEGIFLTAACGTGSASPAREAAIVQNLGALRARLLGELA